MMKRRAEQKGGKRKLRRQGRRKRGALRDLCFTLEAREVGICTCKVFAREFSKTKLCESE